MCCRTFQLERLWLRVCPSLGTIFQAVTVGLLRRSISGEVATGKVRPVLQKHASLRGTLCPPGQSKKAIGPESPIGPCIATPGVDNRQACCFRKRWAPSHTAKWIHRGEPLMRRFTSYRQSKTLCLEKTTLRVRDYVQTVGLNADTK